MRHVHGLPWYQPKISIEKQPECTGNVRWDLHRLNAPNWTDDRLLVDFKGGTLERDLLTKMKIPYLDLKAWGCPEFKNMTRLATIENYVHQRDPWHHHCARI